MSEADVWRYLVGNGRRMTFMSTFEAELRYVSRIRESGKVNMLCKLVPLLIKSKFSYLKYLQGGRNVDQVWGFFVAFPDLVDLMPGCWGAECVGYHFEKMAAGR